MSQRTPSFVMLLNELMPIMTVWMFPVFCRDLLSERKVHALLTGGYLIRSVTVNRHSHITLAKLNSRRADCNPPMNTVIVPQKPIPCVKCSALTKFFPCSMKQKPSERRSAFGFFGVWRRRVTVQVC